MVGRTQETVAARREPAGDDFAQDVALGSFPDAVSDRWGAYPSPWKDTSKNGEYDPHGVISVAGGMMKLHLHSDAGTGGGAADGEIDFPEGDLNGEISAFMHWQNGATGGDQDSFPTTATYANWHTAVTEWTPTATRFLLDGKVIGTSTQKIPNTPMHHVIQTETRLGGGPSSTGSWCTAFCPEDQNGAVTPGVFLVAK